MKKKLYALLLAACLMMGMLVFPVHAETAEGTYGDNMHWHFDSTTGTLTISGTGVATGISESSGEAYDPYRLEIRHIVIEDGFTEIAAFAFKHFFYLESISIGDTVKIIGDCAFEMNRNVKRLHLGTGVTTIGASAFDYMESLEELVLPPSVQSIGAGAFALSGITKLVIPEGVTVLNGGSFRGNQNLTSVTIPTSVTHIKNGAFRDCVSLKDVYYAGTQAQWEAINVEHSDEIVGDATTGGNTPLLEATIHYHTHTWDGGTTNADTTVTYQCTECGETRTEGTPATEPPATEPPVTEPPVTKPAATEPPATKPVTTEPPETEPTATEETLALGGDSITEATENTATEASSKNEPTNPADDEQKTPGTFPWAAVCVGAAVVLAGGGAGIWLWLRKKGSSAT